VKKDHVVIRVHAAAVNPVDYKIQMYDIFKGSYPMIMGSDISGTVYDVHENILSSRFNQGDRVLANSNSIGSRDPMEGGIQNFVSCHVDLVSKVPYSMTFTDAVTLPLGIATASLGLYGKDYLALPYPTVHPFEVEEREQKWLLIWGGTSAIGSAAIQLANSTPGINIVATAGKAHHDEVGALGAEIVFDYNDRDVEEKIIGLLRDSHRNLVGVLDAIGTPNFDAPIYRILSELGGGLIASTGPASEPEKDPKGVEHKLILEPQIVEKDPEVAQAVFGRFLEKTLEKGVVVPAPKARVVGKGLESVQAGIDAVKKGVHGEKIVVEII
jgi:NADPH:quinone reductase-like Zn-dependent oxidoreductase